MDGTREALHIWAKGKESNAKVAAKHKLREMSNTNKKGNFTTVGLSPDRVVCPPYMFSTNRPKSQGKRKENTIKQGSVIYINNKQATVVLYRMISFRSSWQSYDEVITILSHFHSAISKGWSIPTSFLCSILAYWQTEQVATYSAACFILGHKYILLKSWNIFVTLGCILNLLLWASSRIAFLISRSFAHKPYFKPYHSVCTPWNSVVGCAQSILSFVQDTDQPSAYPKFASYSTGVSLESIPSTNSNPWIVLSIQDYLFNHHC